LELVVLMVFACWMRFNAGWPTLAHVARVGFGKAGGSDSYAAGRLISAFGH
jgi:hypothetical protein